MPLREMLTEQDNELITFLRMEATAAERDTDFFKNEPAATTYNWLRYWAANKASLSIPFEKANSLILKKRITFKASEEETDNNLKNLFYGAVCDNFLHHLIRALEPYNNIHSYPDGYAGWSSEKYFISIEQPQEWRNQSQLCYYEFKQFIYYVVCESKNLLTNRYNGPEVEINLPNNKVFKIQPGIKIMRLLGRLVKAASSLPEYISLIDEFENIRIQHSQILNEVHLQGTLCLSIHPVDYMTASYNANDWRSCMHWYDGEFRRGVIEMMNSSYVVCAYLESDDKQIYLGDYAWNSKRWREFFIVNESLIAGIKGYPYWNRDLEMEVLNWLKELYEDAFQVNYDNTPIDYEVVSSHYESSIGSTHINSLQFFTGSAMYNDFYSGNKYNILLNIDLGKMSSLEIEYSGPSECCWCGKVEHDFDNESSMLCSACNVVYYCTKCGEPITDSDNLMTVNGEYFCYDCFNELPSCEVCGNIYDDYNRLDSDYGFLIGYDEHTVLKDNWDEPEYHYLCECCADNLLRDKRKVLIDETPDRNYYRSFWRRIPIITPEEFNPDTITKLSRITEQRLAEFKTENIETLQQTVLASMIKMPDEVTILGIDA